MTDHRPGSRIWRAVAKVMLPFLLFVLVRPLLSLQWPPYEWSGSFVLWLAAATRDGALILPFALFAAGVVLARQLGRSRRLFRVAAIVGISIGAVSYVLAAWVGPVLTHRLLDGLGPEEVDSSGFRPRTPMGIARNLRFGRLRMARITARNRLTTYRAARSALSALETCLLPSSRNGG